MLCESYNLKALNANSNNNVFFRVFGPSIPKYPRIELGHSDNQTFQSIRTTLDPSTPGVKVSHAKFSEIHLSQYPFSPHNPTKNPYQISRNKLDWKYMALNTNSLEWLCQRWSLFAVVLKRVQVYRENHGYHCATPCTQMHRTSIDDMKLSHARYRFRCLTKPHEPYQSRTSRPSPKFSDTI